MNYSRDQLNEGLLDYLHWDLFVKSKDEPHRIQQEQKLNMEAIFDQIKKDLPNRNREELITQICHSFQKTIPQTNAGEIQQYLNKYQGQVKKVFFLLFLKYQVQCSDDLAQQVISHYPDDLTSAVRWAYAEIMAQQFMANNK